MLNFLYVYLIWHLEARGLVTTGQKLGALVMLLALPLAGALVF